MLESHKMTSQPEIMGLPEFLRFLPLRVPNLAWFLGAGASASSGIPTAYDLIWDFKRTLYCAKLNIPIKSCPDLTDHALRTKLQDHFDSQGNFPPMDSEKEYSEFFEAAFPDEGDRRTYIERMVSRASPSYGLQVFAALMKMDKIRVAFTLNFDKLPEDACFQFFGTNTSLNISTTDSSAIALQALNENRWPLLVKMHGDFQSRRIKNVLQELASQEQALEHALRETCKRQGLIVAGYSGRDDSIMQVLEKAANEPGAFPAGIFWLKRVGSVPFPRVSSFLALAREKGVTARFVEIETFDEVMASTIQMFTDIPQDITDRLDAKAPRLGLAPLNQNGSSWPIIRLNALPILNHPATCRLFDCEIGGVSEVNTAIENSKANIIATRKRAGILLFGSDAEAEKAFNHVNIKARDVFPIAVNKLGFDSQEKSLIYEALAMAISRERPLVATRRGRKWFVRVEHTLAGDPIFAQLNNIVGPISGVIPKTDLMWVEALRIGIDYRFSKLWLLIEPTVFPQRTEDPDVINIVKEFIRERRVQRRNVIWNGLLDSWGNLITNGAEEATISAFGIKDGIDASFRISRKTAFSRRVND